VRFIIALFACLSAFWGAAGTAHAVIPVADEACTLSTSTDRTVTQLIQSTAAFDCSDTKYNLEKPRKWLRVPFAAETLPPGIVELQFDINGTEEIFVHSVLKNGDILSKYFSATEIKKHFRPKGFSGLPIPGTETADTRSNITTLYIAFDKTRIDGSLSSLQLASKEKADNYQTPIFALFGLLIGMLLVPAAYTAAFSSAMRHQFLFWHFWRTLSAAAYTFGSSGLIFLVFPGVALVDRLAVSYYSLGTGIFVSSLFMASIIERNKISPWLRYAMIFSATLPLITAFVVVNVLDGYHQHARTSYYVAYVPFLLITASALFQAIRRGSKVAWLQVAAWTPLLLFGLDRIGRAIDLYDGWAILDYGLYFALVLENLIIAVSMAYRVIQLRRQHSVAIRKQAVLKSLAYTDGLTNVGNRRAFEKEFEKNKTRKTHSFIAILDIDFFKQVNDVYGHEVGDEVLRTVGRELSTYPHFAARIGGEEFAILIDTSPLNLIKAYVTTELTTLCESMIKAIASDIPKIKNPVTFSVGIASISKNENLQTIMTKADKRLYLAKENGRNRIVSSDITAAQSPHMPRAAES